MNIKIERNKGEVNVFPENKMVDNWLFTEEEKEEANLADALSRVAEKNGVSINELMHMFPMVLRMLKSNIKWSK